MWWMLNMLGVNSITGEGNSICLPLCFTTPRRLLYCALIRATIIGCCLYEACCSCLIRWCVRSVCSALIHLTSALLFRGFNWTLAHLWRISRCKGWLDRTASNLNRCTGLKKHKTYWNTFFANDTWKGRPGCRQGWHISKQNK